MKQLLSIALGFIVLISQLGLSLATHYCNGSAVASQVYIGTSTLSCGETGQPNKGCSTNTSQQHLHNKSCCQNELLVLSLSETISDSIFEWGDFSKLTPPIGYKALTSSTEGRSNIPSYIESPPNIKRQLQVLYQVFII